MVDRRPPWLSIRRAGRLTLFVWRPRVWRLAHRGLVVWPWALVARCVVFSIVWTRRAATFDGGRKSQVYRGVNGVYTAYLAGVIDDAETRDRLSALNLSAAMIDAVLANLHGALSVRKPKERKP